MSLTLPALPCTQIVPGVPKWLWEPYLPRARLVVLDGEPGAGKSLFALDLAARLSRGESLPDGRAPGRPHTTVFLSGEDDPADTLCPRLIAAGANLANVFACAPGADSPQLLGPEGLSALRGVIEGHFADLLVLDPVTAFLPPGATSDHAVREALAPLAALAAETGCTILLVRHLPGATGPNSTYRTRGSLGLLSLARTALRLTRHPDDPDLRVLAVTKNSLGPPPASLGFRLAAGAGPALQWTGAVDLTAEELCGASASEMRRRPRERAAAFLQEALASGPRPVAELEKLAAEKGLSWRTIERAKEMLRFQAEQVGPRQERSWQWFDPQQREDEEAAKRLEIAEVGRLLLRKRPAANPID